MKKMKRIMCLLLAMVLVLGMSMTVLAGNENPSDDTETESTGVKPEFNNDDNRGGNYKDHTYVAYQIFSGTQAAEDDKLASIEWGSGIDSSKTEDLLNALKKDSTIGSIFTDDVKTAADVAAAIAGGEWKDDSVEARAFARIVSQYITGNGISANSDGSFTLDAGYYLIVDRGGDGFAQEGDAYNLSLLQLTNSGNLTIKNKTDVPTVEKKLIDKDDTTGTTSGWQDAADYDIDDSVTFQLTGTLPANYDDYTSYKYVFHDTLSTGLTYDKDKDTMKVTIDGVEISSGYTVKTEGLTDGCSLEIIFEDLKALEDITSTSKIVVEYTATLNEDAEIGATGNPNEVYLEYSNNPNVGGDGTGRTPVDTVIVFTYEIDANKVKEDTEDESGFSPLEGAGFTLYKWTVGAEADENDPNTADDQAAEGENSTSGAWVKVGDEITGVTTFEFVGVDAGTYKLVETTVPDGYNKADDIIFVVEAKYKSEVGEDDTVDPPALTDLTVTVTSGNATFNGGADSGKLSTDVVNHSGITLPETGGIGTTIFYVIGGILVVGCGVILVTRKRVGSKN